MDVIVQMSSRLVRGVLKSLKTFSCIRNYWFYWLSCERKKIQLLCRNIVRLAHNSVESKGILKSSREMLSQASHSKS